MTTSSGGAPRAMVRARHGAVRVPGAAAPYDTAHYRLFHPATYGGTDAERLTGQLPPDPSRAPWPVAIVLPGINVGPEGTRWLAERLAGAGVATLAYTFVGEVMSGVVGITPGLDLGALGPTTYATRPSATALGPLLDALRAEQATGPCAGLLDLEHLVLIGHSAGGTVALENAHPDWFPGVCAAVTYAAHTMPVAALGHPPGAVLALHPDVPVMLMAGARDGIIARSRDRYGAAIPAAEHDPIRRTFDEGIVGDRGTAGGQGVVGGGGRCGSYLVVFEHGTHQSFLHPTDTTTARGFLDEPSTADPAIRQAIGDLTVAFIDRVAGRTADDAALREALGHSEVGEWRQR